MKKSKVIVSVLLALSLTAGLTGCDSNHDKNSLKDNIIDGWDSWIQSFSKHALTKDKDLKGEKEEGVDAYTGTYMAAYDGFNGKEFIFGGTALNRENKISSGDNYLVFKGDNFSGTLEVTVEDVEK